MSLPVAPKRMAAVLLAHGSPRLAARVADLLSPREVVLDESEWDIDHVAIGITLASLSMTSYALRD